MNRRLVFSVGKQNRGFRILVFLFLTEMTIGCVFVPADAVVHVTGETRFEGEEIRQPSECALNLHLAESGKYLDYRPVRPEGHFEFSFTVGPGDLPYFFELICDGSVSYRSEDISFDMDDQAPYDFGLIVVTTAGTRSDDSDDPVS